MAKSTQLFTYTDPAELLVNAIHPSSYVKSSNVLRLIDTLTADQLAKPCDINAKMAYTTCKLEDEVKRTIGTQCLIYLFDPANGWSRDFTKRIHMLIMASKLVEKGVRLEGISYYDKTIQQDIQWLLYDRRYTPPAIIDDETIERFAKGGYEFDYSKRLAQQKLAQEATLAFNPCSIL